MTKENIEFDINIPTEKNVVDQNKDKAMKEFIKSADDYRKEKCLPWENPELNDKVKIKIIVEITETQKAKLDFVKEHSKTNASELIRDTLLMPYLENYIKDKVL